MPAPVAADRFLLSGTTQRTGKTIPTTESPVAPRTMHPLTHQLAVKRASLDGEPRIVAHAGTMSIVTPGGEIWQVFDSEGPNREMRACLLSDARVWARIFVRADGDNAARIYRFGVAESRSTGAWTLLAQLEGASEGELAA